MEFGSFMEFPPINADGMASGDSAAFDRALDEVETAERVGLDAIWLAELHGAPERSVLSAPMMAASAIAARTSTIRIGIAVQVLPLSHPLRLAEEAATIDQISHGLPIFVAVRQGPFSQLAERSKAYREAYSAAGHAGRGKVFLRVPAYLAETRERARAEAEESLMSFFRYQAELGRDSARRAGGEVAAQRLRRVERLEALTYDEALATQVLIDEPNGFTARLREVEEEIGLDGILAELNCGGRIPQDRVLNALKLLCEEVKPRFH